VSVLFIEKIGIRIKEIVLIEEHTTAIPIQ
jgi:hypothetical protein